MRSNFVSARTMLAMALCALMAPLGVWANPVDQIEVLAILAIQDPVPVMVRVARNDNLDIFACKPFRRTALGDPHAAQPEVLAIYLHDALWTLHEQDRLRQRSTMDGRHFNDDGLMPMAAPEVGVPAAGHPLEPGFSDTDTKTSDNGPHSLFDDLAAQPRPAAWEVGAVYIGNIEPAGSLIGL